MRKLYISGLSPFARAIRVLLHELGLPFETDRLDRLRPEEEFSALNPCIAVPVLKRFAFNMRHTPQPLGSFYTPLVGRGSRCRRAPRSKCRMCERRCA